LTLGPSVEAVAHQASEILWGGTEHPREGNDVTVAINLGASQGAKEVEDDAGGHASIMHNMRRRTLTERRVADTQPPFGSGLAGSCYAPNGMSGAFRDARLFRDDRLRRPRCRDRISMAVNKFPSAVLSPEDAGHSEADRGKLGTATHLGSKSFNLHYRQVRQRHAAPRIRTRGSLLFDRETQFPPRSLRSLGSREQNGPKGFPIVASSR